MVALNGGRPSESSEFLGEGADTAEPAPGNGPWDGGSQKAATPGGSTSRSTGERTHSGGPSRSPTNPLCRRVAVVGDEARNQLEVPLHPGDVACCARRLRLCRGSGRPPPSARVRGLHGVDSITLGGFTSLCAALLDATRATALRLPDARRKLEQADAASRNYDLFLPALGANLVVAHLAELQGDLPLALRAVRRRAGAHGFFPIWHLSTFLREEGRRPPSPATRQVRASVQALSRPQDESGAGGEAGSRVGACGARQALARPRPVRG